MDTRWFQDFVTLAEVRNFTRAADIRNVSQAAFSRRIQGLEQWAGAKLIDRTAFPTRLTGAGERFRVVALELLSQIADVKAEIGEVPSRNHLRIAMPYALATTRLPEWWHQWSGDATMSCSVEVGNVHDTVSAFSAGVVDLLICFHQATHPVQLDQRASSDTKLAPKGSAPTLLRRCSSRGSGGRWAWWHWCGCRARRTR